MADRKDELAEACAHGVPLPSWRFWTYDTKMEMCKPHWRTILIDARDCPQCLKERITTLRAAFQELLYAFAPPDAHNRPTDHKKFSAAYNAYLDDFRRWGT